MKGRCLLKKAENVVIQLGMKLKRCHGDIVILHVVFADYYADLSTLGNAGYSHSVLMFPRIITHMAHENKTYQRASSSETTACFLHRNLHIIQQTPVLTIILHLMACYTSSCCCCGCC